MFTDIKERFGFAKNKYSTNLTFKEQLDTNFPLSSSSLVKKLQIVSGLGYR